MNTKQLKAKVLDLAIHGKLLSPETVAELKKSPEYETADVLLEKIRKEKEEKIAKGELKRDKKDSYIFVGDDKRHYEKFADGTITDVEDELTFEVPEGWSIIHLQHIGSFQGGQTPKSNETTDEGTIPYFKVSDMNVSGNELYMNKVSLYLRDSAKYKVFPPDSIIYPKNGGAVFTNKKRILTVNSLIDLNTGAYIPSNLVDNKYAYYLFSTIDFNKYYKGTSVPTVDHDSICELFFGLPPLVEQKEIVKKLFSVFKNIDILEEDKVNLQETVSKTKSKILDLAIHGKLVPQDVNDEPASVLLDKLRAEKEDKIAKGELKRDKNDSYIYKGSDNCYYEKFNGKEPVCIDEEIPFDIPENWQWTKLGRICTKLVDGDHNPPKGIEEKTDYIMASSRNINHNTVEDLENVRYLTKEMFEIENQRTKATEGDIFFTSVGTLGRSCIYDGSLNICFQRSVSILNTQIDKNYLKYFFDSNFYQDYAVEHATGTAQLGFYLQEMSESYIAIPPISEQKRIVSKIEEMFERLDQIQSNLI